MSGVSLPLLLGFLLGLRHAFEPDHLAAVAALLGKGSPPGRFKAARVGAWWGAGHAAALLLAGSGIILLGWRVPAGLDALLELGVAALLVVLGGRLLLRLLRRDRAHLHLHEHDGLVHAHLHFHSSSEHGPSAHRHHLIEALIGPGRRPFLVGMVHGLSGTGAATLLVLAASPSAGSALTALALFAAGALTGMAALSWLLGLPLSAAERRSAGIHLGLQVASGLACLLLGLSLAGRTLQFF
ncbi:MAG: hypothetical protein DMH00_08305 [Acidobacteria bacterium]|nr:MAG: hypothetical protein DMH00_08305 [Acidobacteriota bacterium]